MNHKKQNVLFNPMMIILIIITISILTYYTGGIGTIVGIVIATIALFSSGFDWKKFGIQKPDWAYTIGKAFIYAVLLFLFFDIILQPVVEIFAGQIDLSELDHLRGNLKNYLLFCLLMWTMAAFGEEYLYRGYLMKHLAQLFGSSQSSWILSSAIIGVIFGLAHLYQGLSGVIITGLLGFLFGVIFSKNRNNLWLIVITHGLYNMIGITMIYLDCERIIVDKLISIFG